MLIIVTGKAGVGKTTILKNSKYKNIIFLDEVIKNQFYQKGTNVYNEIIKKFNDVEQNGKININKLGKIIFEDQSKLKLINSIVIPEVKEYLKDLQGDFLIEMAAFINYYDEFKNLVDKIILVKTSQIKLENKFNYLKNKTNPISDRKIKYDHLIFNDWNIKTSVKKLDKIIKEYNFN